MAAVDPTKLLSDLTDVVSGVREANPATDPAIDGVQAAIVCRPGTAAEAAAALAVANRHGAAVAPVGGGTKLGLGNPPRRLDVILSLDRLTGIVDYSPADLTVTCRAGTPWRDLQAHLADHGQFVPLDPPFADRATVGGVLATSSYGPSRTGHGTARDHLIGIQVANPNGALTKAGGKVVKNVAGYDLNKLYIGSLGTVGVITEATWKLLPLPVSTATLYASFAGPDAPVQVATRIVRAGLQPRCAHVFNTSALDAIGAELDPDDLEEGATPDSAFHLFLRFSGRPERVGRQLSEAREIARVPHRSRVGSLNTDGEFWTFATDWPTAAKAAAQWPVLAKIVVRPTDLAPLLQALSADVHASGVRVSAQPAVGVVHASLDAHGRIDAALGLLGDLRAAAVARGGSLVIEDAPVEIKRRLEIWGDPGDGLPIMRRLKENLDPKGILNPGRFVAGI